MVEGTAPARSRRVTEVRWSAQSLADLDSIDVFYRTIDGSVADRMAEKLLSVSAFLANYPFAGLVAFIGNRRKWRVRGTPYNMLYRVTRDHIRILRIVHVAWDQRIL